MFKKKNFKIVASLWFKEVLRRRKKSTQNRYEVILNNHLLPVFSDKKINKITKKEIIVFFDSLKETYKRNTILCILNTLKSIFRFADKTLNIKVNMSIFSDVSLPKSKVSINTLSLLEASTLNKYLISTFKFENLALGVLIALNCGLRIGEICALKWENIDLTKRVIYVNKTVQRLKTDSGKTELYFSDPKTFNSKRAVPIPDLVYEVLRQIVSSDSNFILSNSEKVIEPRRLEYYFSKISEKVIGRKVKFHDLRHTYATLLLQKDVDVKVVSSILGHASVNTTLNFYRGVTTEDFVEVGDIITFNFLDTQPNSYFCRTFL